MSEEKKLVVNVQDMVVEASYAGPKLNSTDDITPEWIINCMDHFRD